MKRLIICSCVVTPLLIAGLARFCIHRDVAGRPIIWDLRASRDPSVIGWKPKDPSDTLYQESGDIDFTLFVPGDRNSGVEGPPHAFHQKCWAIGCQTDKGKIVEIYAHFGRSIKVADAVAVARQVLLDWYGGEDKIWYPKGDPSTDEWLKSVAAGTDTRDRYLIRAGGIYVALTMTGGAYTAGLDRTCSMTLSLNVRP